MARERTTIAHSPSHISLPDSPGSEDPTYEEDRQKGMTAGEWATAKPAGYRFLFGSIPITLVI
jgi:hypothetical protein